jgi:hypothetical protein
MTYQIFDEGHMLFDLKYDPAQKNQLMIPKLKKDVSVNGGVN